MITSRRIALGSTVPTVPSLSSNEFQFFKIIRWIWDSIPWVPYDSLGDARGRSVSTLRIMRALQQNAPSDFPQLHTYSRYIGTVLLQCTILLLYTFFFFLFFVHAVLDLRHQQHPDRSPTHRTQDAVGTRVHSTSTSVRTVYMYLLNTGITPYGRNHSFFDGHP